MNTRTISVILLALVVVGGGVFFFGPGNGADGSPPFETPNQTPTDNGSNGDMPQGVENGQVTQQAVVLSSLEIAQETVTIERERQQGSTTESQTIVYSPQEAHKLVSVNDRDVREYYYAQEFTAVQEFQSNGYELGLEDPNNQITEHTNEAFLRAFVNSISLTLESQEEVDGKTQYTFTADQMTESAGPSPLARHFSVDEVSGVNEAKLVMTEDGVITSVTLSMQVTDGDSTYPVSQSISVEKTPNANIAQPRWVQEALSSNAGLSTYIVSDSELVINHKYGRTISTGDTIQIQTPTGNTYTKTVDESFSAGDQVVFTRQNGSLEMTLNPNESVEGGSEFVSDSGTYVVTVYTEEQGVVSLTTTQK